MKLSWRTLTRRQAERRLFQELRGRIFHITSTSNFLEIVRAGAIKHNRDGELKSNGNYNAYFKNRGCVSFCDLHGNLQPRKVREAALRKYDIFGQGDGERSVFLFLHPSKYEKIISWTHWKAEKAWSEMVVPHLEAGYPGSVPLHEVEEALLVHIPLSESAATFLRATQEAQSGERHNAA
ncbi:MAG: hypothetical protein J0I01_09200 [Stenotrophomonas nitritireducens]|uniref:hypothetical protein n=1 Tax=Stenotrophomonas nitritireducens TaxID=83617 RepID=UPI001AD51C6B|nr:hypothetical protein [Stenotrophomonas nitritireducens]MBN8792389.1 hypothetical protein [Stenotrophomonas nitritireducens]MBN8797704.1 hypothetical protein [Stenotrophomonas nitritireducens]